MVAQCRERGAAAARANQAQREERSLRIVAGNEQAALPGTQVTGAGRKRSASQTRLQAEMTARLGDFHENSLALIPSK